MRRSTLYLLAFPLCVRADPVPAGQIPSSGLKPVDPVSGSHPASLATGKAPGQVEFERGWKCLQGVDAPPDPGAAVKWLRDSAQHGYALGEFFLGSLYAMGTGVTKDPAEADRWLRAAGEHGNPRAQVFVGRMYEALEAGDGEAVKWYRRSAEQNCPEGELALALAYATGAGVARDPAEALRLIRKAADQGYSRAQKELGDAYSRGDGVTLDPNEALKWYRKAADQANDDARVAIGLMFWRGRGVAKDSAEAVKWFHQAAEHGSPSAQLLLGRVYATDKKFHNVTEAANWYRKAAEHGNADAAANLGMMYANGVGVAKDGVEGLAWIDVAVDFALFKTGQWTNVHDTLGVAVGPEGRLAAQRRSNELEQEIRKSLRARRRAVPTDFDFQ